MAHRALDPAFRRVQVEELPLRDFGGATVEQEDDAFQMMIRANAARGRVTANIIAYPEPRLRGAGGRPYGCAFADRPQERTMRLPDEFFARD